jgi:DNA-binding response OmpR family regulator
VTNTGEKLITVREATEVLDETLEKGYLVLDWRDRAPEFSGPLDTVRLEPRVAELLDYLLTNPGYLTTQQIKQAIWPDSPNPALVKRYINKLRAKLWPCFQINTDELIKNVPNSGYCWCSEVPYCIIKTITQSMNG